MTCKYEDRCMEKNIHCKVCSHNPKAKLHDYYFDVQYLPRCSYGADDCIHDPANKLRKYDKGNTYLREKYTREELEAELKKGCCCDDGDLYEVDDK